MESNSWTSAIDDDGLQFQLDEQFGLGLGSELKLEAFSHITSPSSPSSEEPDHSSELPLSIPIFDSPDTLKPSDILFESNIFDTSPYLSDSSQLTVSPPMLMGDMSPPSPAPSKRRKAETPTSSTSSTFSFSTPLVSVPPSVPSTQSRVSASLKQKPRGRKPSTDAGGLRTKRERNKASAAKYRKRRKVYLDGLEDKLNALSDDYNTQNKTIASLKTENQMLKEQLAYMKKLVDSFTNGKSHTPKVEKTTPSHMDAIKNHVGTMFLLAFLTFFLFCAPVANNGPPAFDGPYPHSRTLKQHINETELSSPLSTLFEDSFSVSTDSLLETVVDVAVQTTTQVLSGTQFSST